MAEPSTRAKWRALRSARVSTLKKCLTAPTLSETPGNNSYLRLPVISSESSADAVETLACLGARFAFPSAKVALTKKYNYCHDCGNPILRTSSTYRGSERRESKRKSVGRAVRVASWSSYAVLSHWKA